MKVWLVYADLYEDRYLAAVCSTPEIAEAFAVDKRKEMEADARRVWADYPKAVARFTAEAVESVQVFEVEVDAHLQGKGTDEDGLLPGSKGW